MDYKRLYNEIIERRQSTDIIGYGEWHHIIPRSLGGSNDEDNLVLLTAREHFLCHYLLTKMYEPKSKAFYAMVKAFCMMGANNSRTQKRYINSRLYESNKKHISATMSILQGGKNNSQYGTCWINNSIISKKIRREHLTIFIDNGWVVGRLSNGLTKNDIAKNERQMRIEEIVKYYSKLYALYNNIGFIEMVKTTGYDKSKPNFVNMCSKYVKEYSPQNGKRRGTNNGASAYASI